MLLSYPARWCVCIRACVRARVCVCARAYVWVSERMLVYFFVKILNKIQTDRRTYRHASIQAEALREVDVYNTADTYIVVED